MVYEVRLAKLGGARGAPTGLVVRAANVVDARSFAGRYYFENGWNGDHGAAMFALGQRPGD